MEVEVVVGVEVVVVTIKSSNTLGNKAVREVSGGGDGGGDTQQQQHLRQQGGESPQ